MRFDHRTVAVALCLTVAAFTGACQKSGTQTSSTSGTESPSAQGVQVARVELGTSLANDNTVANKTDSFLPNQTIYASVVTNGSAPSAELKTRFTYQDGQVVDESTRTIAPSGQAVTEFHVSKPDGFPVGKYKVEVFVNGTSAATKEFEVKNT
jgi:hypothetical protein